ncbi:unnamed protein product [Moneuplotes crassus]|uniref:Uncharacterized protein n=1 Tax=Euplotes crassus TaxID=5936 RepID=A0AAD1XJW3_EUPCR|nr:unnamed protein product [Moneuplotes crassus]
MRKNLYTTNRTTKPKGRNGVNKLQSSVSNSKFSKIKSKISTKWKNPEKTKIKFQYMTDTKSYKNQYSTLSENVDPNKPAQTGCIDFFSEYMDTSNFYSNAPEEIKKEPEIQNTVEYHKEPSKEDYQEPSPELMKKAQKFHDKLMKDFQKKILKKMHKYKEIKKKLRDEKEIRICKRIRLFNPRYTFSLSKRKLIIILKYWRKYALKRKAYTQNKTKNNLSNSQSSIPDTEITFAKPSNPDPQPISKPSKRSKRRSRRPKRPISRQLRSPAPKFCSKTTSKTPSQAEIETFIKIEDMSSQRPAQIVTKKPSANEVLAKIFRSQNLKQKAFSTFRSLL